MRFIIRDARESDLGAAAALAAQLVRFHHALDPQRFAILSDDVEGGYVRFLRTRLRHPKAVVLVAQLIHDDAAREAGPAAAGGQGAIVGYAYGEIEPPSWPDLLDTAGRIHDLIVDEAFRCRGVGRALAEAMVERLTERGAPRCVLTTAFVNEAARRIYRQLGFRETSVELTRER